VVFELRLQFCRGVERVVLHHGRTEAQDGGDGDDVLRAIRQRDGHAVSAAHAELR